MLELAAGAGIRLPADDAELLHRLMVVEDARNLEDYLRRFEITIALLQTEAAIERVADEIVADAARQNIRLSRGALLPDAEPARWALTGGGDRGRAPGSRAR